jgi:hypothetical protein
MKNTQDAFKQSAWLPIFIWGGIWGIFEVTVGYLLHLLPFKVGWLVWYPVASFFMLNVYRRTRKVSSILYIGFLSASIKLLNLFLPGRIDRVINPAVSIILEALSMAAVIFAVHALKQRKHSVWVKAVAALCMNTGWRLLYVFYVAFLVPGWMREISVIRSADAFVTFFVVHNLFTSLVLFLGALIMKQLFAPIGAVERKITGQIAALPPKTAAFLKVASAAILIFGSISLELIL